MGKVGNKAVVYGLKDQKELGRVLAARRNQLAHKNDKAFELFRADALARRLKVHPGTVHRIEGGERWPQWDTLAPLLDALGLDLALVAKSGAPELGNL